jgi:DNA-directed RNA polymerase subunit RPC12/RpoP
MINRMRLSCVACGRKVITRTGIGHSTVQKHKFACPTCGIEIGFILDLDQEKAGLSYREPTNAVWAEDPEEEDDHKILFYPELMVPHNLGDLLSPFLATAYHLGTC